MFYRSLVEGSTYGQATARARSGNPVLFLARSPAWRRARENRRFLGVLSGQAARARVCTAAHRRDDGASSGDRRTHHTLLRELRIPAHLGGRSKYFAAGDLWNALSRRNSATGFDQ